MLIKYWHSQGLRGIIYLDNGVAAEQGKETTDGASKRVKMT